jgi:CBS domain containing-hemolysin-like protein
MSLQLGRISLNLLLVLILVGINGFFVAAEFALVKIRRTRLQELLNQGNNRAKHAMEVTDKLDTYLSASQLGITLASLGIGYIGEPAIAKLIFEPLLLALGLGADSSLSHVLSFLFTFATITFLHITLGEQAPKNFAIQRAEGTALWISGILILFTRIFKPFIWVLNAASNGLLRMIGVEPANEHEAHTEEEIRIMLGQSAKSGHIDNDELKLFDNIFEFSERVAREIMVPRTDMECLYADLAIEENLQIIYETKHTRYPVADKDKDRIIGFVHITDILTAPKEKLTSLQPFLRPVLTVHESMELNRVLQLMQKRHSQLAIVLDEYGGTAGLLTTEGILEEIVGDMQDEFDGNERAEIEVKPGLISVDGKVLIEELIPVIGVDLDDDEVDSIGGWLFKNLEGDPALGMRIAFGGLSFEVAEMDRFRILRVNIHLPEEEEIDDPEADDKAH